MNLRTRWLFSTLLAVLGGSREAWAQSSGTPTPPAAPTESHVSAKDLGLPGFDTNAHYVPTPGDRFLGVADGVVYKPFNPNDKDAIARHLSQVRIDIADFAFNPLKLYHRDASGNQVRHDYLNYQFYVFRIQLAATLTEHIAVGGEFAFGGTKAAQDTDDATTKATTVFGDPRFFARVNFFGDASSPLAVGLQGDLWVPIGTANKFTGDEKARFLPRLMGSGVVGNFFYAVNGGLLFRHHYDFGDAEIGNAITYGAAMGFFFHEQKPRAKTSDFNAHQFGVELYGNTVLSAQGSDSPLFGRSSTPAELLFHYRGSNFTQDRQGQGGVYIAAGPGLTRAPGVPTWRLFFGVDLAGPILRPDPVPDTDGDGVPDPSDECPNQAGTAAFKGCPPPPDDDHDGVPNKDDKCPDVAGPASSQGCPPPPKPVDKDKDGVVDAEDACPGEAGIKTSDPLTNGCPDSDKDGVVDKLDACPNVSGVTSPDPKKNGCPSRATLQGKQIVISEQVLFHTGTDRIDQVSEPLLNEVADILKEHPEIELLSVEGHSDNLGNKAANKALSLQRAEAVKKSLVAKGVEGKRLVAVGLGDAKPIADNKTEEGRAKNRRVEFHATRMAGATEPTGPAGKGPKAPPVKGPAKKP